MWRQHVCCGRPSALAYVLLFPTLCLISFHGSASPTQPIDALSRPCCHDCVFMGGACPTHHPPIPMPTHSAALATEANFLSSQLSSGGARPPGRPPPSPALRALLCEIESSYCTLPFVSSPFHEARN